MTRTQTHNERDTLAPDERILLRRAASMFCSPAPSPKTVNRWCTAGVKNKHTGEVVRLRYEQVGGRFYTSLAWMDKFKADLAKQGEATCRNHEARRAGRPTLAAGLPLKPSEWKS